MRIEIRYGSSLGNHPIDLSVVELGELQNANELFVRQDIPPKTLRIEGTPDELELLANALLNRARELRRTRA
jgi:hypothetical protein